MKDSIQYLKEQLDLKGEQYKNTRNIEYMRDCLAIIDAINVLEERRYGKKITDITFVL